jgi:hypothetical protein
MGRFSITIDPAAIDLRAPTFDNPQWRLWYRSLIWLAPLAVESYTSTDAAGRRLVAAYVRAALRTNPDPGSATRTALALAKRYGWDEQTNTRRHQLMNCLLQIQPNDTIVRFLHASIRANLDGRRYYGLPRMRPHNHGLLANRTLIDTGVLLGRPRLIDAAEARLRRDVRVVLDPACGMTFEQSSGYQRVNARWWRFAAQALSAAGRTRSATVLRQAAIKMAHAHDHIVMPDGTLAPIGDANPNSGFLRTIHPAVRMFCPAAGWAAGRTSWLTGAKHYTLRFGPRRSMHGHNDHGSVTWAIGDPVLVDPGLAKLTAATMAYARSNAAHNVLGVSGTELGGETKVIRMSRRPARDVFVLRDGTASVTRTRSVWCDRRLPFIVVLDRARATTIRQFSQRWHFDLGWSSAGGGRASRGPHIAGVIAVDLRSGRRLTVDADWAPIYPRWDGVRQALLLRVRTRGTATAILSVVYRTPTTQRPTVRWRPGTTPGSGVVRVWCGTTYRDIRVDATGFVTG